MLLVVFLMMAISRANAAMWLDLDYMTRGEHIWEIWE
jgi:hypothetical protein